MGLILPTSHQSFATKYWILQLLVQQLKTLEKQILWYDPKTWPFLIKMLWSLSSKENQKVHVWDCTGLQVSILTQWGFSILAVQKVFAIRVFNHANKK